MCVVKTMQDVKWFEEKLPTVSAVSELLCLPGLYPRAGIPQNKKPRILRSTEFNGFAKLVAGEVHNLADLRFQGQQKRIKALIEDSSPTRHSGFGAGPAPETA